MKHWTKDETEAFAALYINGKSLKDCCIIFGRTEAAAIKHMQQCGIVRTCTPKPTRGGRPKSLVPNPYGTVELRQHPNEPQPLAKDDGCRWLHGDVSLRNFCGHETVQGSPWCPIHHARCYSQERTLSVIAKCEGVAA